MLLAKILSKIFKKESGIVLIDYSGQKYICGRPKGDNPITLKLLKKNLNWKLILNPDLNFPVAYMNGDIVIENASLLEFLNLLFKNLGNNEITRTSYFLKKISSLFKNLTPKVYRKLNLAFNTTMIWEGKREKNFMISFFLKIDFTAVPIGNQMTKHWNKLSKIKLII